MSIASGFAWWSLQTSRARESERLALGEVERLIQEERTFAEYRRFRPIRAALPNDPDVRALEHRILWPASITTDPPGALIEIQEYQDTESPWETLGETPLEDVMTAATSRRDCR